MFALGQKRTSLYLFDHFVSKGNQPRRHLDAKRSRCLQIDDEFEFGRLQHGEFSGLGAFENVAGIDADLMKHVREVGPIAH